MEDIKFPEMIQEWKGFKVGETILVGKEKGKIIAIIPTAYNPFKILYENGSVYNTLAETISHLPKEPVYVPFEYNEMPNLKIGDVVKKRDSLYKFMITGVDNSKDTTNHIYVHSEWKGNNYLFNNFVKLNPDGTESIIGKIKE